MGRNERLLKFIDASGYHYQPIYGHPELSRDAPRGCEDRLKEIVPILQALERETGRPLRILDLGCAQGYFCFSLAAQGALVTGVDSLESHVDLCRELSREHRKLKIRFERADIAEVISKIEPGDYDVVLALSVFHHIAHKLGFAQAKELIATMADKVPACIFELALTGEPEPWAASLPTDERDFLDDVAFSIEIARFPTHLSDIERPLVFASNTFCYLGSRLHRIEHWSMRSHKLIEARSHHGTRRYYEIDGLIAKVFRLVGPAAQSNRVEIEQEAGLLSSPPPGFAPVPRLVSYAIADRQAWLIREKLPGEPLIDRIVEGRPYDANRVIRQVLDHLCTLETAKLYHGDLRVWNVLIDANERVSLIDFGAISRRAEDGIWPHDIFLAFLIFVSDVVTRNVTPNFPQRTPFVSPYNLPAPYRRWAESVWALPREKWSFDVFRRKLKKRDAVSTVDRQVNVPLWIGAVERHLEGQVRAEADLSRRLNDLEAQLANLNGGSDEAHRAQAAQLETLTALLRDAERDRADRLVQIQTLTALVHEANADRDARLSQNQTLTSLLKEAEAGWTASRAQIDALTTALQASEADGRSRLQQIEALSRSLEESERDRAARLDQINTLAESLRESEADRLARGKQIDLLTTALQASDDDRRARLEQIESLTRSLDESHADRAARLDQINTLTESLRESEADRLARGQQIETLSRLLRESMQDRDARFDQIGALTEAVRRSESDRVARGEQIDTLTRLLTESESDRAARAEQIETLTSALHDSERDRRNRAEQIETLTNLLAESESDRAARAEQIATLTNALRDSEVDRAARLDQIHALTAALRQSETDRSEQSGRLENQSLAIESLRTERTALEQKIKALTQRVMELERDCTAQRALVQQLNSQPLVRAGKAISALWRRDRQRPNRG